MRLEPADDYGAFTPRHLDPITLPRARPTHARTY